MPFIISKLIFIHDGDMLVGVLTKKYVQKNARSAFQKGENVCDTIFDEWGRIFENDCLMYTKQQDHIYAVPTRLLHDFVLEFDPFITKLS